MDHLNDQFSGMELKQDLGNEYIEIKDKDEYSRTEEYQKEDGAGEGNDGGHGAQESDDEHGGGSEHHGGYGEIDDHYYDYHDVDDYDYYDDDEDDYDQNW